MSNTVYRLKEILKNKYSRIYSEDEDDYIAVYALEEELKGWLICIRKEYKGYYYGKIGRLDKLTIVSCRELIYSPYGLFVFARTDNELITKIAVKTGVSTGLA